MPWGGRDRCTRTRVLCSGVWYSQQRGSVGVARFRGDVQAIRIDARMRVPHVKKKGKRSPVTGPEVHKTVVGR